MCEGKAMKVLVGWGSGAIKATMCAGKAVKVGGPTVEGGLV